MVEQYFQNSKSLRSQGDGSRALPQAFVGEVKPKLSERYAFHECREKTGGPMILRLDSFMLSPVAKYCFAPASQLVAHIHSVPLKHYPKMTSAL